MDEKRPLEMRADRNSVVIAASIIAAAFILSWGLSGDEPRYQLAASGDMVVRMDTDSGELLGCTQQRCARIEAPDRAKRFGALTVEVDRSEEEPALAPPEQNASKAP